MRRLLPLLLLCLTTSCVHAQGSWSGIGSSTGGGSNATPAANPLCVITTTSIPSGIVGTLYTPFQMASANCVPTITWSETGTLPTGLTLSSAGLLSGTPSVAGSSAVTVTLTDGAGHSPVFPVTLTVTDVSSPGAPLAPDSALTSWDTSTAGTPTLNITDCVGTPINASVLPGGGCHSSFAGTTAGLQAALNAAACGHIINIAALSGGTTIVYGSITLPNLKCTNTTWWGITGDLSDPAMPPDGTRIDPCYVGIPQIALPSYPYPLADATPNNCTRHLPLIQSTATSNNPPIRLTIPGSGANTPSIGHLFIQRLQCGRDQSADALTVGCIALDYQPVASGQDCALSGSGASALPVNAAQCAADQPDHIVIRQIVSLADPQRQTIRAIAMGGGTFIAIKDSWIQDIHDTFAGGQGDAQSVQGGTGHGYTEVGDWIFQNNFTSSSTEGQIFCGGFTETKSPVTNSDGVPTSVIWNNDWFYKTILWDTQRGQTLNETLVNEGVAYPPQGDQEIVWQPTAFTVQQGSGFNLNNTWLNDSAGGWNRFNIAGTPPNNTGTATIDGIPWTTITSANGILTKTVVNSIGSNPWQVVNTLQWTYVACSGSNVPAGIGCTGATTPGAHSIVLGGIVLDSRVTNLGGNRTLSTTITATVTTGAPTNLIALTPSAPDLQMQPSYSDSFGNVRTSAYVFTAAMNFSSVSMTWKVDGIANGNSSVGQVCSVTAIPCTAPGSNDQRVVYVAPSVAGAGSHTITVTSAAGTVSNPVAINVSLTSPSWGYDLKANTVKNMWEAKCLNRGLLENTLLENTYGTQGNGGGQYCGLLNQPANNASQVTDGSGATVGYGPQNISDLTVDHVHMLHGGGLVVAGLNVAKGIHRLSYSNLLMEDVNGIRWGHGFLHPLFDVFLQFSGTSSTNVLSWTSALTPITDNINFSHITEVGGNATTFGINSWLSIANYVGTPPAVGQFQLGPFSVKDSIFESPGVTPFYNNNGEAGDCGTNGSPKSESVAFLGTGNSPPTPCFSSYSLARNLLLDNTTLASKFVTSTIWNNVNSTDPTVFRNYNNGSDGDYRVVPGSQYDAGGARDASDGSALGADVLAITTNDHNIRNGVMTGLPFSISTTSLPAATAGSAYSQTLAVSGGTAPYQWTISDLIPQGSIDTLDYACAPFRATQHLTGATSKYCVISGNMMMWIKSGTGCPADGEAFDGFAIYQDYTEGPTFTNCSGYKMYVKAVPLWKRFHVPGADDVILTPGPNKYNTTESCGSDHLAQIDNLDIKGELTGPFTDVNWQTDCIAGGGSVGTCNVPDGTPYMLAQKFIKGTAGVYQTREQYWLVKGFGQVQWTTSHLSGGSFVIDQTSTNETLTAGGNPTPNFACGIPAPAVLNGLPPGTTRSSAPPMALVDSTGNINGVPSPVGTYPFVIQVEDANGNMAQKQLSIAVH